MPNFFEHQSLARRNTRLMVVMFVLAVVAVIVAVDLVIAAVYIEAAEPAGPRATLAAHAAAVPRGLYLWGAAATAALILVVSLVNVAKLAGGGKAVAEMIGARRVAPETKDPLERRLVNVVEEMAIAAGVRVPAVYVMDAERGINAFAAGWDVSNSVVAVTRGTLETLTRDELQGVIGHEFSHILNGDMRLNIRMIGVLAGIVFIGSVGEFIMRNVRGSRNGKGSGGIVLVGLALFVIGYVGLFFARLIKAAVSRQREFLADASSVQFTRNPDGIAGALDQIGRSGALISSRYAEEMSHMFFGQSVKMWLGGLFDTHPALEERIRRVHPRFEPSSYRQRREAAAPPSPVGGEQAFGRSAGKAAGRRPSDSGAEWGRSAAASVALVGALDGAKVDYAARLLASIPETLRESLRSAEGAAPALVALLLAPKDEVVGMQLAVLEAAGYGALAGKARELAPLARSLGPAYRLPAVDLALPAAKALPEAERRDLLSALEGVVQADRRVSLHEFVVLALVREQLAPKAKPGAAGSRRLAELAAEAATLLAIVAHAGVRADPAGERRKALERALAAGAKEVGISAPAADAPLSLEAAEKALQALKALAPMQKAVLVKGLFAAATADGSIRVAEAELLRMAGAVLDCPLPPLLETLDPATLAA